MPDETSKTHEFASARDANGVRKESLADLLNRAAAAIENPGDLTDEERQHVVEDLLAGSKWAATVYVGTPKGDNPLQRLWATAIPKVSEFPADSVQCDRCGGLGCDTCEARGWLTPRTHAAGRRCANVRCQKPLVPSRVAIYCSDTCAADDR